MTVERDTKQRIIHAAVELFHARSYDAVGVAEICQAAGVVKGSFYHFFASKDDLVLAVIDAVFDHFNAVLKQVFADEVPPLQRIERLFHIVAEQSRHMKRRHGRVLGCPFGNLTTELSTQNEAVRRRLAAVYDRIGRYFEQAIRDAIDQGQLDPCTDVRSTAQSLVAFMQGLALIGKAYNRPAMMERLIPYALQMIQPAAGLERIAGRSGVS